MHVVIFRAATRQLDAEYSAVAQQMRRLAMEHFGCLAFVSACEDGQEIALSYWPDADSIRAWKAHADHVLAQQLGRERWYRQYRVEVACIERSYEWTLDASD
ncbi:MULTISPECIES: antibiotic biosynthesis monooxygenase [Chromobacterium]|uniref:antibiotic biosynthesis monooxygenase family protein n=1 Tax=Chromobacterium TaxID=535 RepID=UPI001D060894|nr:MULTISPECIES: antibiotic biosynthesis monooxygenase [Chromobacterium]MCP1291170.1 antibiotic biosynthesis monooxygenase [Chromobacterium sp. S0633]UJB32980.1 antibiotic biosynthesis monooxygenase [Chromobacterium sp. Beijing]